jgi:hypothetical protein
MIRMNTDTPVGSEPGSGARSCTCSGSYGRRGVVNPLVRAAAVPGLAALRITRLSPWRPARIAAYAWPPRITARAAWAVGSGTSRRAPPPWRLTTAASGRPPRPGRDAAPDGAARPGTRPANSTWPATTARRPGGSGPSWRCRPGRRAVRVQRAGISRRQVRRRSGSAGQALHGLVFGGFGFLRCGDSGSG